LRVICKLLEHVFNDERDIDRFDSALRRATVVAASRRPAHSLAALSSSPRTTPCMAAIGASHAAGRP